MGILLGRDGVGWDRDGLLGVLTRVIGVNK
jgi:hypothetical protein